MTVDAANTAASALQLSLEQMSQGTSATPVAQATPERADRFQWLMQKGR